MHEADEAPGRRVEVDARGYAVLPQGWPDVAMLTPEERDWMRLLTDGWRVRDIAITVGVGERELYRRLAGVYQRLGARSRTEALVAFRRLDSS